MAEVVSVEAIYRVKVIGVIASAGIATAPTVAVAAPVASAGIGIEEIFQGVQQYVVAAVVAVIAAALVAAAGVAGQEREGSVDRRNAVLIVAV